MINRKYMHTTFQQGISFIRGSSIHACNVPYLPEWIHIKKSTTCERKETSYTTHILGSLNHAPWLITTTHQPYSHKLLIPALRTCATQLTIVEDVFLYSMYGSGWGLVSRVDHMVGRSVTAFLGPRIIYLRRSCDRLKYQHEEEVYVASCDPWCNPLRMNRNNTVDNKRTS